MRDRFPPLGLLRLFEAAARHRSFKAAAQELGVTPSAVSHGIGSLEKWFGIDLFERTSRGISLTAAGQDHLPYVSQALSTGLSPVLGYVRPAINFEIRLPLS
jgi:DNA-binding transcriptional LysR family regulator